jgi:hypothetical protein
MSPRIQQATPLARPVDLRRSWNATDAQVAARLHALYGPALSRLPSGPSVFRGLPFALAPASADPRWILLDENVTVDLGGETPGPGEAPVSHIVVAHFCDSARGEDGERPPGMPVGWVLPAGQPLARYEVIGADDGRRSIGVRRRFQLADGIIGWGFLPFEALGHRADEPVDWRGPHPRQSAGRYASPGHAGPLGMLPAGWGPAQTSVSDFVPTPDDDITLWLHAIPVIPGEVPAAIRLAPLGDPRPGDAVVVAAITLFRGSADPLVAGPRREILVEGPDEPPTIDLGLVIRSRRPTTSPAAVADGPPSGWGHDREGEDPAPGGRVAAIVDLAATPDARLRLGDEELAIDELDRDVVVARGSTTIRALPAPTIRVDVRLTADGIPSPARVRFVSTDGRYLPPLGHRDDVNPGLLEDSGADVLLGPDTYAYVDGMFRIDLPPGAVDLEVVKGFDFRPVTRRLDVDGGTREVVVDLERTIDLRDAGWRTSDSHVHYIAPSTALLQAAAEDVASVHLLATQAGDLTTNGQDLAWGSQRDPSGRYELLMGTENRQNLLGHLALLGARRPVLPMASGGAPEGRLGGPVDELLADWADQCRAQGGLVVGAHFPLPYAEVASMIVGGDIDAVELQTFAPGLDHPPITEWYRFLNCGYRLPVLGGTDKMSAEVPVGAIRTYARLDPGEPATFDAWAAAVRAGRTFATSGPVVELAVDGLEPGSVVALGSGGGTLEVRAVARAAQAVIDGIEIVVNGHVVAAERASGPVAELRLATTLAVRSSAWISARVRSPFLVHSAFATAMAAHTSPVYVEVVDRPLSSPDDAAAIGSVIDGTARWVETIAAVRDERERMRMVERVRSRGVELHRRIGSIDRST